MYNQSINSNEMCQGDNGSKNRLSITWVKTSDRSRKMVNRNYTAYQAENSFKRNFYKIHTQCYTIYGILSVLTLKPTQNKRSLNGT